MAGTLGKVELLPPADLDQDISKFNIVDSAMMLVQQRTGGLIPNSPPGYAGTMPPDITLLDDNGLGQLLNVVGQWCSYLDFQVARADSERMAAEASLTYIRARIRLALKAQNDGKKLTVQDKNDKVDTDPRVVQATSQSMYAESIYKITKTIRDKAQLDWETVSRRITQRGQEVDRMRRESQVSNVPVAAARAFRHT